MSLIQGDVGRHSATSSSVVTYRRRDEDNIDPMTRWGVGLTLLKCNWGIGMMAIPYLLDSGGLWLGTALFIASMFITRFSIGKLIKCKEILEGGEGTMAVVGDDDFDGPLLDYTGLIKTILGPRAELCALLSLAISMWGSCIAYLKFIHDNMPKFIGLDGAAWVGMCVIPAACLASFDDIQFLSSFATFGVFCGIAFATVLFIDTADSVSGHDFTEFLDNCTAADFSNIPLALSISAFCNEGIVVLSPSAHNAMHEKDSFLSVVTGTIFVFSICYLAVGFAGYLRYFPDPDGIKEEFTQNMDGSRVINKIGVSLYCLQLIPTFAVVYYCSYEAVEWRWCRSIGVDRGSHEWTVLYRKKAVFLRILGVVIAAGISLVISDFADVLGLVGALGTSIAVYVLPHLAWLKCTVGDTSLVTKLPSILCCTYGVVLMLAGSAQSLYKIIK